MHDDVTADGSSADGTDSHDGSATGGDRAPAGRKPRRSTAEGAEIRPGSLLWTTAGDPRAMIPGLATGIMQLMLPGLGAGVTDYSDFFNDPFDRIDRSIPLIWGSIFAPDDEEGRVRGRQIRDFHVDIKGTDGHGKRYHALDPDVYWWAHATFTWEYFRARELFFPCPLTRRQKDRLYAETVTWYRRYGVSDRPVPATYREFRHRFDEICRHELELTPAVQWVLDQSTNPAATADPVRLPGVWSVLDGLVTNLGTETLRLLVYGPMPDVVRRRFDLPWSHSDRVAFTALCATIRAMDPAIRRGALDAIYPEGTPHPDRRDPTRLVVAGPNRRQRALAAARSAA